MFIIKKIFYNITFYRINSNKKNQILFGEKQLNIFLPDFNVNLIKFELIK